MTGQRPRRPLRVRSAVLAIVAMLAALLVPATYAAAVDPCATGNAIVCENSKPGSPPEAWEITGTGDDTIQGFATDISVNLGQTEKFKIKTDASSYTVDVYRLGWYGGDGARKIASVAPVSPTQKQPACVTDATTNLYDCGTWAVSASWTVPGTAVSGVYIAVLTRSDTGGQSHIPFVVRDDSSHSDVVYQTSDTTWQAYNTYGGANFYSGDQGRAYKLSYNRPFSTRGLASGRDYLFSNEYPMIRFLERNGYDLSYISGVDSDRYGSLIKNHKTFLSVGHDEYWSGNQRANVEAARDAGVNLAFFSGNEVYWKTRYEPSIDGSSTAYRTLVCYKETWDNAKTDPTPAWTGTWRDPRFSPPADGGRPENGLTGTAYMSNNTDLPVTVNDVEGRLRLWRNTSLASLASGTTAALTPHTVGYESDEDLDNGFRPAGTIDLSTTTGPAPQYLQDFGNTTAPGTTTHHLTMYRAASGALVFSAGSIQWAWGLDAYHDGDVTAEDSRMQQATVNLLADMSDTATTLQAGLVAATRSTDTTAPTSTITSPVTGTNVASGTRITVTGTATDAGGGRVGGVEVSTDGGATWHPASGRGSWSYSYDATGSGPTAIRSRATDDSGNIEPPGAGQTINVSCPCSLWPQSATPKVAADSDGGAIEVGVRFTSDLDGYATGVRFYKGTGNGGTHTGHLWSVTGQLLASVTFTAETATGWQSASFSQPVQLSANTPYVVSYFAPQGHYAGDSGYFSAAGHDAAPLHAPRDGAGGGNGLYRSGSSGFPTATYQGGNYWVDVVFGTVGPPDTTPPGLLATSPVNGATKTDPSAPIKAQFSESVTASTIGWSVTVGGTPVSGTAAYDAAGHVATFTPAQPLPTGGTVAVTLSGAKDWAGNVMTATSWSFTTWSTPPGPGVCPCTIWPDSATPATVAVQDTDQVELGVKFRSDQDGYITGLRFYKSSQNTGPHVGTLWTSTGVQLASTTFYFESTSGWQTISLPSPVAVTAGTTYVASYHTTTGYYSASSGGLSSAVDSPPLHALASGVSGGNGVYAYGDRTFPTSTSSDTNYWVDVVYADVPDTTPPTVAGASPSSGATRVPVGSSPKVTFSEAVTASSVSLTVTGPGGTAVAGSTSYDATTRSAVFTPTSPLAGGTTYTMAVSGATDRAGNTMTPTQWTFTTQDVTTCPCTLFASDATPGSIDSGDPASVELGTRFTPTVDGYVTGVRFYKAVANTGTHVGTLWSSTGQSLASVTFSGESASGWQQATFSRAVPVLGGSTYTVSYLAPNGHYSADAGFFSGAWSNAPLTAPADAGVYLYGSGGYPVSTYASTSYAVEPVFNLLDPSAPLVTSVSPLGGATSVPTDVHPAATFSNSMQASSVSITLKDANGVAVPGATAYDSTTSTAAFTPSAALSRGVAYTATASGTSSAGVAMTTPYTWSFTTAQPSPSPGVCPCSLWDDAAQPATVTVNDPESVELGVRFTSDRNGYVTGIRFYKGPQNTGTHIGTLWSASGTSLASAAFSSESVTGWQTVTFASAVPVTAGTVYVASYRAPAGMYSVTLGGLAAAYDNPPLHVAAGGAVYTYGTGAPDTGSSNNYWVDPVFSDSSVATAPDTTAPTVTSLAAAGSGTTATVSWSTDESATSRVDYGTSASSLTSTAAGATGTSHSVTLAGLTPSTRYYLRVTSADAAANSTTTPLASAAPASYVPSVQPAAFTTMQDFNGTLSNAYLAQTDDGEVLLRPVVGAEFSTTGTPTGFTSSVVSTGGTITYGGGAATLAGTRLYSTSTWAAGRTVEARAVLATGQSIGWASIASGSTSVTASFSVNASGQLVSMVNDGGANIRTTVVPGSFAGTPHTYDVEWTTSGARFLVDGVQVDNEAFAPLVKLRVLASDPAVGGGELVLDWVRSAPYTSSGTYTSAVLDPGAVVGWDTANWDALVPTGTAMTVQVRSGSTPTPGTGWTGWATVSATTGSITRSARYLQFRLQLTSTGTRFTSPAVRSLQIAFHVL